ncbi:PrgI family protein [Candidatus Peregrinibacteria bacterium]|nr:PrgI family protein [Candidatus Peregrinibacteria bacterium]
MLQYKIPQNVGIEDKIVGPFSLRQLIILAVGAGVSYVLFAITSRIYELNIIEYILIALPALFALAIAILKIHNVTFGKYILLMLEFAIKPKKRLWDHRGISALVAPDLTEKSMASKEKAVAGLKAKRSVNLRDISATLDSGGFEHVEQIKHEDIDEAKDDDLITEAYFGHKQKSKEDNMYWRTRDVQKKKLNLLAKMETVKTRKPETPKAPVPAPALTPTSVPASAAKETLTQSAKKESVVEHLASVIKEARQNNVAKKQAQAPATPMSGQVKPVVAPTASIPSAAITQQEVPVKKKRRRKKKKSKEGAKPIREDTQINTTSKSAPNKVVKIPKATEGEMSLSDLSAGGEIEINLD